KIRRSRIVSRHQADACRSFFGPHWASGIPKKAIAAGLLGRPQSEGPCRQGSSVAVAVPDTLILNLDVGRLIHGIRAGHRSEAQVRGGRDLPLSRGLMTNRVLGSRDGDGSGGEDERD